MGRLAMKTLLLLAWVAVAASHNAQDFEVASLSDSELGIDVTTDNSEDGDQAQIIKTALADQGLSDEERAEVTNGTAISVEEHGVPDSVECYWALVQQKLAQEASLTVKTKAAEEAYDELTTLSARMARSIVEIAELGQQKETQATELEEARNKYKRLHEEALKTFYTAKGDLNNYSNERKKVDLDAAQSKSTLLTYLKYKKAFIEASADAENPSESTEVQHYKKLSAQYLDQYHVIQGQIQRSYSGAKQHQKLYFDLSKQYHQMTEESNDVAKKVEILADQQHKTKTALNATTTQHDKDLTDLPTIKQKHKAANMTATEGKEEFDAVAARTSKSKLTFLTLRFVANRLSEMGNDATSAKERNQLRYLDFSNKAEEKNSLIEGMSKSAMMLQNKLEAANKTAVVYQKSFDWSNCARVLAEVARADMSTATPAEVGGPDKDNSKQEQCEHDKTVADANREATTQAKEQHMDELTHLAVLRKEHEQAVSGANTAASLRDTSKQKAKRLNNAAEDIKEKSAMPCK